MRSTEIALAAALFLATPAPAQTPDKLSAECAGIDQRNTERMAQGMHAVSPLTACFPAPQTFGFSHKPSAKSLRDIASTLRTIVRVVGDRLSVDSEASTLTVHGTAGQLEMAAWLVQQLDQPAYTPGKQAGNDSMREFHVPLAEQDFPGRNDEVIRVFFLAHTRAPLGYQEILTTLHLLIEGMFTNGEADQFVLVARGFTAQIELAANLINALDIAPGAQRSSQEFPDRSPGRIWAATLPSTNNPAASEVVRVFYLAHATAPKGLVQTMTALRTVVGVERVFLNTAASAIVVRGTTDEIAAADWLIQSLDIPADATAAKPTGPRELHLPDGVIRVFYLEQKTTPEGLKSVLKQLQAEQPEMKLASFGAPPALVVRGSADQIAKSEQSLPALPH